MQLGSSVKNALLMAVTIACLTALNAQAQRRVVEGEYVVTQAPQTAALSAGTASRSWENVGTHLKQQLGFGKAVIKRGAFATAAQSNAEAQIKFVNFDQNDTTCADLINSGLALTCSPNWEMKVSDIQPNDQYYSALWGMKGTYGIAANRAWDLSQGSSDVVVAIIDTGVDYNHPELAANMWRNTAEVVDGIDNDGNGVKDDIYGANFVGSHKGDPMDDNSHGTHVAGTIGAVGNNSQGVVGVNWRVKIMALKFLSASGSGSLSGAIQAINYMVMMKNRGVNIRVSNNSWGGGGFSQALSDAIERANAAGIIFAAAAGNESNDNDASPSYPASYDFANVVSVAAIDQEGNLAGFSNYGQMAVDIAAPGVDIKSTTPGNTYATYSGTSMATPHVAGALALLAGYDPGLSATQLISRLYDSGVNLNSLSGVVRTSRTLNVARMLNNETSAVPAPPTTPDACNYAIETIAYAPDTAADTTAFIQQADELNYATVELPFTFPFKNMEINTIKISPNGVIYVGNAPSSMDYQNTETAPIKSIAALNTDLVAAVGSLNGVRVYTSATKAIIYWNVKSYNNQTAGNIEIRAELNSDGTINNYIYIADATLAAAVARSSTIGVNGALNQGSDTYAYNEPTKLGQHLGVRFTPQCQSETARVEKVNLTAPNSKSKLGLGKAFKLKIKGTGYGNISVSAKINGELCSESISVAMTDGVVDSLRRGVIPKTNTALTSFAIVANSVEGKARFAAKRSSKARNKLSSRSLEKLCLKAVRSLR